MNVDNKQRIITWLIRLATLSPKLAVMSQPRHLPRELQLITLATNILAIHPTNCSMAKSECGFSFHSVDSNPIGTSE